MGSGSRGATCDDAIIELCDVDRRFGSVAAVRGASLVIRPGDHVAIVGQSGSGKSTVLNLLGLLDRPTGGQVLFDGSDISTASEAERAAIRALHVSFVYQAFHLLDRRTVLENVEVGLLYQGIGAKERRRRAYRALVEVNLGHRIEADPRTLSGGERQRVAVARALARASRLMLADEPTGSLDTATTGDLLATFDSIVGADLALVVVTHDPLVAARASAVFTMSDGVLSGPGR